MGEGGRYRSGGGIAQQFVLRVCWVPASEHIRGHEQDGAGVAHESLSSSHQREETPSSSTSTWTLIYYQLSIELAAAQQSIAHNVYDGADTFASAWLTTWHNPTLHWVGLSVPPVRSDRRWTFSPPPSIRSENTRTERQSHQSHDATLYDTIRHDMFYSAAMEHCREAKGESNVSGTSSFMEILLNAIWCSDITASHLRRRPGR